MLELKNIISTNKEIEVEHPLFDEFKVKIAFVSKEMIKKLITKATSIQYDSKARQQIEKVDDELFLKLYTSSIIKGWKGLKLKYLPELIPVDMDQLGEENEELVYSEDNALALMKNSTDFDAWISSVISDIKNFNKSN